MDSSSTLILKLPRNTETTPDSAKMFLASLTSIKSPINLEIISKDQEITFQIVCSQQETDFIESQLVSSYPLVTIQKTSTKPMNKNLKKLELSLASGNYYPIKTYPNFKEIDSLSPLLSVLTKSQSTDFAIIKFELTRVSNSWQTKALSYANFPEPKTDKHIIEEKVKEPGFVVKTTIFSNNQGLLTKIIDSFNVFARSDGNKFKVKSRFSFGKDILNIEELATLWHLPSDTIKTTGISYEVQVLSDPPHNLPVFSDNTESKDLNFFAKTIFKNKETIFGIKDNDRRRHIWAIGKTGTGKSTLIANMAIDDIRKGKAVAVIDPHGDLAEILLDNIPNSRVNDVIYFNPADKSFPITINPLEVKDPEEAELVVSGIISIMSKIFGKFWGPRIEYILRNSLFTLTEVDGSTLKDIPLLLTDSKFRQRITKNLKDPVLKNFWENEFEKMPYSLQKEAVFPILTRVGQFVTSPMVRNVIGNPKSSIDLENVIESKKILIANLSQGKLGEDNASLLGAMLITKLQLAVMKRANVSEGERQDFYLYVDEFQNFATNSFIKILSEARKYKLNLMLANQYIAQIPLDVQKAILGNIGTLISFSSGAQDATVLNKEFSEVFSANDLISLKNYQIAIKLNIDGYSERPFLATTLPLPSNPNHHKEKIVEVSRQRWGRKTKDLV